MCLLILHYLNCGHTALASGFPCPLGLDASSSVRAGLWTLITYQQAVEMVTGSADATAAEVPGRPAAAANGNGNAAAAEAPEEENGDARSDSNILEPGESFAVTEDGRFVLGAAFQVPSREEALRDAGNASGMAWVADSTNGDAVAVNDFVPLMSGGRSGEGAPAGLNNGVSSGSNNGNGNNSNSSQE
ncbi:hypothetical protein DL764_005319 [Monosporascus ibericus]|uniref:YCII-related domain-containing protein n=1 Tax=Monosporascus ibericus TaxID=155417 RepID=A0A4Q4TCK0_9PEZI|nr:hypothetical protein DL764_005319 [Monosporascus ibericus]